MAGTDQHPYPVRAGLPPLPTRLADTVRSQRGIEDRPRWVLDVVFHDADGRARLGHAPEDLATVRRLTLNLLRQDTSSRRGSATKRLRDALDNLYLSSVLIRSGT